MLSDYEFELIVQDLLQKELGIRLESFKKGRDNGIDLRYSVSYNQNLIIQCKHYVNSKFSNLKSDVNKKELEKIQKLAPSRYLLVTSLGLTPSQKDELFEILSPFCKSKSDIYGKEDLNNLLRQYPKIEKSHYKLWFTSTSIMEKIVNSKVYNRSEVYLHHILDKLKIYVQSKVHLEALKVIKKSNVCIISGIPGIGKTTLAEMLLIEYLEKGYEIIKISQSISEAYEVLSSERKQIFFYDDFLGQTTFDIRLNKNADNEILNFIKHIKRSKNSKFILTTREYILNQAKNTSEPFRRSGIDLDKMILELEDYTELEKAKILYNHIYYNQLPRKYIENLLENNILKIITHKNYNPRIIEIFTENLLPSNPSDFYRVFIDNLENPSEIWDMTFRNHLSRESKNLLLLLSTIKLSAYRKDFEEKFNYYHSEKSKLYNQEFSENDFINALKELDGTFIENDAFWIRYANPSVRDYIENYILKNEKEFEHLCECSLSFEQCISLFNISKKDNFKMLKKYKDLFVESILLCIIETSMIFRLSICEKILTLMRINEEINMLEITNYIKDDFFANFQVNFDFYGVTIGECIDLLTTSKSEKYKSYFDKYIVKEICEVAIILLLKNEIYDIKDFGIVEIVEELSPGSISSDTKKKIISIFENFYEDLNVNSMDWNSAEKIEEYLMDLEKIGDFLGVYVGDCLYDLETLLEELESFEADEYNESGYMYAKDVEQNILDLFDSLLEKYD